MRHKRSSFTLIEVIIVIMIVGIVGTVFSIGIYSALRTERYRSSLTLLEGKLQLAQDIMLHTDLDTYLSLWKGEDGIIYAAILLDNMEINDSLRAAVGKSNALKGIRNIVLRSVEGLPIMLEFFSGGGKMTEGNLVVSSFSDEECYIPLIGSPGVIKRSQIPYEEGIESGNESLYPEEIRS